MKRAEYFYMGKAERELPQKIEGLIIECGLEVSGIGIELMEINDLKMMNAYIKSNLEAIKPSHYFTTMVGFAAGILTIFLKEILIGDAIFGIVMCLVIFIAIFFSLKVEERNFKKKVSVYCYLSNLLDVYIEERNKSIE
ncbi:hypothetical protein PDJ82_20435 [Bacillus cereus group sp. TH43LC]|uniref:hypothetical protein n=1 Tax=Bacillus cereus group TaxID=86661 RepID=UPI0022E990D7|nr:MULTISPECIES: hypothetical protein [unclassified Bacillus cereus group]MDA1503947.1 hypothetical protein [Bacillus cereus group sp. TH43LC]MDA1790875.1 hypothetical protein [Bacillus cereus group sp. BY5-1LC]